MPNKDRNQVNEVAPRSETAFVRNFFKNNNALMLEGAASIAIAQARKVDKLRELDRMRVFVYDQLSGSLAAEKQSVAVLKEELAEAKRTLKDLLARFRKFRKLHTRRKARNSGDLPLC